MDKNNRITCLKLKIDDIRSRGKIDCENHLDYSFSEDNWKISCQ